MGDSYREERKKHKNRGRTPNRSRGIERAQAEVARQAAVLERARKAKATQLKLW